VQDVAGRYRVEALPTFVLMKNREEQRRVVGPKVDELNTTIRNSI
jgi:thioredoxin 1